MNGIAPEIKEVVLNLYGDGKSVIFVASPFMVHPSIFSGVTKPALIKPALEKRNIDPPRKNQISNFLQYRKKKTPTGSIRNELQFKDWCKSQSNIPTADEPDRMFVISYGTSVETRKGRRQNNMVVVNLFVSTRRLLQNAMLNDRVHIDATYKLNQNDFPVFVIGTTDQDRVFHPFGLGIAGGEKASDYSFMFKSLADGIRRVFDCDYRPRVLIADSAEAY